MVHKLQTFTSKLLVKMNQLVVINLTSNKSWYTPARKAPSNTLSVGTSTEQHHWLGCLQSSKTSVYSRRTCLKAFRALPTIRRKKPIAINILYEEIYLNLSSCMWSCLSFNIYTFVRPPLHEANCSSRRASKSDVIELQNNKRKWTLMKRARL